MRLAAWILLFLACPLLASPADTDSIDNTVRAVYDTISGPAGTPRDWNRFKQLFADSARLIAIRVNAGVPSPVVMTPEEFAQRSGANSEKNPFYESEIAKRVETFGNIAHVFSTY